jgi:hypothetical protein
MLLVNQTYCTVTHESAENGDFADRGFVYENEPFTFRELVASMRVHYEPSSYPAVSDSDWFTSGDDIDYVTGASTQTSIHFSRSNPPRKAKYWIKAAKCAGVIGN